MGGDLARALTASVIVCTRNRAELLKGSLDSLLADRPSVGWEVIVVDNASTDETAAVVSRCRAGAPDVNLHYVLEERLGLSPARNRGIAAANGNYLLFTDDDVLVQPGWVDALCAPLDDPAVVAVAGRVLPKWPFPPPRWLSGRHAGILALTDFGDEPRDLVGHEVPVGASMAIRASGLEGSHAPFDPRLGHRAGTYFAYEEHALFLALRDRGRLVYRPDATVLHRILPQRMTWDGMRRAVIENGYGSRRAERLRGAPPVSVRRSVPSLLRTYAVAARQSRRNGDRDDVDPDAAFAEFRGWWALGRWIEALFGDSRLGRWLLRRAV